MAAFSISKPHTMSLAEIRDAAEDLARGLKDQHGLSYSWRGDTAVFSRSGINGKLIIDAEQITVSVKLGILASAFQGPLKRAVKEYLDQHVA